MPPKNIPQGAKTIIEKDPKTGKKRVIQYSKQAERVRRFAEATNRRRDRTLKMIKKDYKRLPWTSARRKELDKLLPLAVGAEEYDQPNKSNFHYAIGFTLYFKDRKEKRFPYPRKERSESIKKGKVFIGDKKTGKFIYNFDMLNNGY